MTQASPRHGTPVVVIGGGPAGLSTAIALAEKGASVTVLEPRKFPIDKPCGEGLMPDAVAALECLGVDLSDCGRPIQGITYVDGETRVEGQFPGRPGRGVRRTELHGLLLDRARSLGVELLPERARGIEIGDSGAVVETESQELERQKLEAEVVVGADGLRSRVRHWAGLDLSPRRPAQRFGVRRHFALAPWNDRVEVHWSTGVEAYVTPCGANEIGIALLWQEGQLEACVPGGQAGSRESGPRESGSRESGRGSAFDRLLGRFPALEDRLAHAIPTSKTQGIGPLWQETRSVRHGPVVLVGDAAGYVDAITGEGLALTFQQALALGDAFAAGRLGLYPGAHRRLSRRPEWMTRLALVLSPRPRLRRRFLRALAKDPRLFDRLLRIHVGEAPRRELVSSAARLGLGLALS